MLNFRYKVASLKKNAAAYVRRARGASPAGFGVCITGNVPSSCPSNLTRQGLAAKIGVLEVPFLALPGPGDLVNPSVPFHFLHLAAAGSHKPKPLVPILLAAHARLRKRSAEIFKKIRPGQVPQPVDRIAEPSRSTTTYCRVALNARKPWWIEKFFNLRSQMRARTLDSAGVLDYSTQAKPPQHGVEIGGLRC